MAFDTRRQGQQAVSNIREQAGDVSRLNTMSPRVSAPTWAGAGRQQRINDQNQRNMLEGRTLDVRALNAQKIQNAARLALQNRGMKLQEDRFGEGTRRFDLTRGDQQTRFDINRGDMLSGRKQNQDNFNTNRGDMLSGRKINQDRFDTNRKDKLINLRNARRDNLVGKFDQGNIEGYINEGEGGQSAGRVKLQRDRRDVALKIMDINDRIANAAPDEAQSLTEQRKQLVGELESINKRTPEEIRKSGELVPRQSGKGARGTGAVSLSKQANRIASDAMNRGITRDQIYDDKNRLLPGAKSMIQRMENGDTIEEAIAAEGMQTDQERKKQTYEQNKQLIKEKGSWFNDPKEVDDAQAWNENYEKEQRNAQRMSGNKAKLNKPKKDIEIISNDDIIGSIASGTKEDQEDSHKAISEVSNSGDIKRISSLYNDINKLKKTKVLPFDAWSKSRHKVGAVNTTLLKNQLATKYASKEGIINRGIALTGDRPKMSYNRAYSFWSNKNKKKKNHDTEAEFQTMLSGFIGKSFGASPDQSFKNFLKESLDEESEYIRNQIDLRR